MKNIEMQVGISLTVYFWCIFFIIIFLCTENMETNLQL